MNLILGILSIICVIYWAWVFVYPEKLDNFGIRCAALFVTVEMIKCAVKFLG